MQGANVAVVRRALERHDPLPGGRGFAGTLDGRLVRDVLGRYPLFSEPDDPTEWSPDPTDLSDPRRLPAGHVRDANGDGDGDSDTRVWSMPDPEPSGDATFA